MVIISTGYHRDGKTWLTAAFTRVSLTIAILSLHASLLFYPIKVKIIVFPNGW